MHSPLTPAPHPSQPPPVTSPAIGFPAPETPNSPAAYTPWRAARSAETPQDGPTTAESEPRAKPTEKPCAASKDDSPTSSTDSLYVTQAQQGQARRDTRGRLQYPARPAHPPLPALRTSHSPGQPNPTLQVTTSSLDTERRRLGGQFGRPGPPTGEVGVLGEGRPIC